MERVLATGRALDRRIFFGRRLSLSGAGPDAARRRRCLPARMMRDFAQAQISRGRERRLSRARRGVGAPHRRYGDARLRDQARNFGGPASAGYYLFTRRRAAGSATAFWCSSWRTACAWSNVPDDLPFAPAVVQALHYHYQFPRQPDGARSFSGSWRAGLTSAGTRRAAGRCWSCRRTSRRVAGPCCTHAGVPRGAWFVALHVRDIRLERSDRRHAGDPQRRHRGLCAGDRRNNPPRRLRRAHGRRGRAAIAAARQCHRLLPQRHARGLDGYFPSWRAAASSSDRRRARSSFRRSMACRRC